MDTLVINISWEYFLGLLGGIIAIAYYTNGRFTALETNVEWLKEMVAELHLDRENERAKLFKSSSPVSLTPQGYHALARSGLRSFIDANKRRLLSRLEDERPSTSFELQDRAFRLLADLTLAEPVAKHVDTFAFANGVSTKLLRRVGAIYLRDLALQAD